MTKTEPDNRHEITLIQPRTGYRYNEDSFRLVEFIISLKRRSRIIDLGAGCGVIGLSLANKFPGITVTAVEIQTELCDMLRENARRNGLTNSTDCVNADYRKLPRSFHAAFDAAVTNPPYRRTGTGRLSTDAAKAAARHECDASIEDTIAAAARLLKDKGKFYAVFLTERLTDLICAMRENRIEPKKIQPLYPASDRNSSIVLIEGVRKGGTGLTLLPPLLRR